jgi:hypothetical protein
MGQLTEVQIFNLSLLTMLSEYVRKDRILACALFGLDAAEADLVASLNTHRILSISCHTDECLFKPRNDFHRLLSIPPQLAGVISKALRP